MTKKSKIHSGAQTAVQFVLLAMLLLGLIFLSINLGSIHVGFGQLLRGLFVQYDSDVAAIYDLRFPRVLISAMAGAGLAAAGTLLQAVLKNPLADPGILGVSGGAGFAAALATALLPQFYFIMPLFSFVGGLFAFALVYVLAWKGSLSPLRMVLVGVAVQSFFTGLSSAMNSMSGSTSGVAAIVEGNIAMKTWQDVRVLAFFCIPGLLAALLCWHKCNLLGLEDKTLRGLGIQVDHVRFWISLVAVWLVGGCTAIAGAVSFLGLLAPHIGRLFVGSDHRKLLPFSMLLGAFCFLLADTVGRCAAYPYEISASVILSVAGGVAFVILLKRSESIHG